MKSADINLQQPVVSQLTAWGLLRDSVRLTRRVLGPVVGIATFVAIVQLAFNAALVRVAQAPGWALLLLLAGFVATTLAYGTAINLYLATARDDDGGLFAALGQALRRVVPLCVCHVLAGACISLGLALFIVPGVILALGWSLAAPAMVDDELGPIEALRDSWSLTDGHRSTLFGALLTTMLACGFVGGVGAAAIAGLAYALPRAASPLIGVSLVFYYTMLAPLIALPVVARLRLTQ